MHKLFAFIGAAALALTLQLAAATPSRANPAVIAAAIGFGLLGLGVGAAVAGPLYGRGYGYGGRYGYDPGYGDDPGFGYAGDPAPVSYGGDGHIQACSQTYRSYNVRSDTYVGFDGRRHQCTL